MGTTFDGLYKFNEDWYDEEDKYSLVGQNGNAFALMGYTARCMRECGLRDEVKEMQNRAMSGDYNNLICVCDEYVQRCNKIANEEMYESYSNDTNDYRLLSRMKSDCDYYLNTSKHPKHLWAGDEQSQINKMKEIWNNLKEKPEWLSMEDINDYAQRMGVNESYNKEVFTICKVGDHKFALGKGNPPIINGRKTIEADSYDEAKEILMNNGYSESELVFESFKKPLKEDWDDDWDDEGFEEPWNNSDPEALFEFNRWYNSLSEKDQYAVDNYADECGIGYYNEASANDLYWLIEWFNNTQSSLNEDASEALNESRKFYFGKEEAEKYGDMIEKALTGKTVSKSKAKAEEPGGLIYEANKLGIDMWDLLEALEGMCYQGRCREIDDSTYLIGKSGKLTESINLKADDLTFEEALDLWWDMNGMAACYDMQMEPDEIDAYFKEHPDELEFNVREGIESGDWEEEWIEEWMQKNSKL